MGHHFTCHSEPFEGPLSVLKLADALTAGPPSFETWLDKRNLQRYVGDWDVPVDEAIHTCDNLIFVMTPDSVEDQSVCEIRNAAAGTSGPVM